MSQLIQHVEGIGPDGKPFDPHGGHVWYPPGVSQLDGVNVTLANRGRQGVIAAAGNWSNFAVYADVPNTWDGVTFIMSLKVAHNLIEIDRKTTFQMEHLVRTPEDTRGGIPGLAANPGSRVRGQLFQLLGRPSNGSVRIEAIGPAGQTADLTDGRFYISTWGTEGQSNGDRVGRPIIDRWGARHQNVRFSTANLNGGAAGTVIAFGVQPDGRAIHITDIQMNTEVFGAVTVALEQFQPEIGAPSLSTVANFRPTAFGGSGMNLAFPYTGQRGYQWRLTRGAGVATIAVNINGYLA